MSPTTSENLYSKPALPSPVSSCTSTRSHPSKKATTLQTSPPLPPTPPNQICFGYKQSTILLCGHIARVHPTATRLCAVCRYESGERTQGPCCPSTAKRPTIKCFEESQ